jgi:hypothetical protein
MITGQCMDCLDRTARHIHIRQIDKPFGGIQVSTGLDFFRSLERPINPCFLPHIDSIFLFPTRKEVAEMNQHCLDQLADLSFHYDSLNNLCGNIDHRIVKNSLLKAKLT